MYKPEVPVHVSQECQRTSDHVGEREITGKSKLASVSSCFLPPANAEGNGFTPVCVCVCVCVQMITFEPFDLLI